MGLIVLSFALAIGGWGFIIYRFWTSGMTLTNFEFLAGLLIFSMAWNKFMVQRNAEQLAETLTDRITR